VGYAGSNEEANKLFVEAYQLVEKAQKVEKTSYSDALKLYEKALRKIESIPTKCPSSDLAVKILQNKVNIGPYTIKKFKESIIPLIKLKSEAEKNPLACALLVAKTIEDAFPQSLTLCEIANSYTKAGQKDKASEILSQALRVARTIEVLKSSALHDIADSYAKVGQKEKALQIARTIEDAYYKSLALRDIADSYAKVGQYNEALQVARTIKDASLKSRALCAIADGYTKAGQKEKASKVLSQALQVARTTEGAFSKSLALRNIADSYAKAGQKEKASKVLSQALQVARTIEYASFKSEALHDIADSYAKVGQKEKALQIARTIKDAYYKSLALHDIADSYAKAGQKEKASELLSQALQVARTIEGASFKSLALCDIADSYAKAGQKEKASELLSQALQVARTIEYASSKSFALSEIADSYTKAGLKVDEKASKILHQIITELNLCYSIKTIGERYNFRQVKWGMTSEQVKKIEKLKLSDEGNIGKIKILRYTGEIIGGLSCDVIYIFANNCLTRAKYIFTNYHTNKNDYISDYKTLKNLLIKKHGTPYRDEVFWKNNLYKDDPQYYGFAISIGHLAYFTMWDLSETIITLGLSGENFKINLVIEYTGKRWREYEKKVEEKKTLDNL